MPYLTKHMSFRTTVSPNNGAHSTINICNELIRGKTKQYDLSGIWKAMNFENILEITGRGKRKRLKH